jgi:molybdopterin-containing oxidoreductase family membrane subunit
MATAELGARRQLTLADANEDISRPISKPAGRFWALLLLTMALIGVGAGAWFYQIGAGLGVAGITHPVMWGVYITNFVGGAQRSTARPRR